MKKRFVKIAMAVVFALAIIASLTACAGFGGNTESKFSTFSVENSTPKASYGAGDTVYLTIVEGSGAADLYNVYIAVGDGGYEKLMTVQKAGAFSVTLPETPGETKIAVYAVVDGVELQTSRVFTYEVRDKSIVAETLILKNNVVDLYNDNTRIKFDDLEFVYSPTNAYLDLKYSYDKNNEYYSIDEETNVLTGEKYSPGMAPLVIPFYVGNNLNPDKTPKIFANLYVRLSKDNVKGALTNFNAYHIEQNTYTRGDTVDFQCVPFCGMNEAVKYIVYRYEDGEFVRLAEDGDDVRIITAYGNTFYRVKVKESGALMKLRFNAVINNVESESVYDIVDVALEPSTVMPTEMTIAGVPSSGVKSLCLEDTFQITPEMTPADATETDVSYTLIDNAGDYISVSSTGLVTANAVTPSAVTLRVTSEANSELTQDVQINVLDIRADSIVLQNSAPLSQKVGSNGNISFTLNGLNEISHSRKWYVDNVLVSTNTSNAWVFSFTGTEAKVWHCRVDIVIDIDGEEFTVSKNFDITLTSGIQSMPTLAETYMKNISVTPEAETDVDGGTISWRMYDKFNGTPVGEEFTGEKLLDTAGSFFFKAILRKNSSIIETKSTTFFTVVDSASHELFDIAVDGYKTGTNYAPMLKWYDLDSDVDYVVEITNGGESKTYDSTLAAYENLFGRGYFKVPYADFSLADAWSFRIKTSVSQRWTKEYYYGAGQIAPSDYSYLEAVNDEVGNFYFTTIRETADMLNYLTVFTPAAYYDATENTVTFNARFAVNYADYKDYYEKTYLPEREPISSDNGNPYISNAMNVISAANLAYGQSEINSTSYSIVNTTGIKLELTLHELEPIDQVTTETFDATDVVPSGETRYSATPRGAANSEFPIDSRQNSVSVTNGKQLLLAVQLGFKPLPTADSVAESIYNAAKNALNQIIDDEMTDAEKVAAIYDYLCVNITYDYALASDYATRMNNADTEAEMREVSLLMRRYMSFALDGAFINKVAVCDGITKAFSLMCNIEEITNVSACGLGITGSGSENHAWSMVMLDGEWYFVDATWGRALLKMTPPTPDYVLIKNEYFLTVSEDFVNTHRADGVLPVPAGIGKSEDYVDATVSSQAELEAYFSASVQPKYNSMHSGERFAVEILAADDFTFTESVVSSAWANALNVSATRSYDGDSLIIVLIK